MIKITFSKYTLKFKKYLDLNEALLHSRYDTICKYYQSLLSNKIKLYSQFINKGTFPNIDSNNSLSIHLVRTNWLYGRIDTKFYSKFIMDAETQGQIPSETTHIWILSAFGTIVNIISRKGQSSCIEGLYGNQITNFTFNQDEPIITTSMPFGSIIGTRSFLNNDQLGFRYTYNDLNIFNSKALSKYFNVVIVGGSFSASVWSLPGESFTDKLQELFNIKNNHSKPIKIWNLAQGSSVQNDNFGYLINTGLFNNIDLVLWVDGLNDLSATLPAEYYGIFNTPISFPDTWYRSYRNFSSESQSKLRPDNYKSLKHRIEPFLRFRKMAIELLAAVNVNSINILQPTVDRNSNSHTELAKHLFNYYSFDAKFRIQEEYINAQNYVKVLAKSKFGIDFIIPSEIHETIDFWDFCHMSPKGEEQFANFLFPIIDKSLD